MSDAGIKSNISSLMSTLQLYARTRGKTVEEAVVLKAGEGKGCLATELRKEFLKLAPPQGDVREERLAALKMGQGVHVRPSVRDGAARKYGAVPLFAGPMLMQFKNGRLVGSRGKRKLNLQALMVRRELNLRERGRGFLAASARFGLTPQQRSGTSMSRYGYLLGVAGLKVAPNETEFVFRWGGMSGESNEVVKALRRPKGQAAIRKAFENVRKDTMEYVAKKFMKGWKP